MPKTLRAIALAVTLTGLASCAVGTASGPQPKSMPASRAGLLPEYRIFYDTLQEYGDWVLVEPYGYLFRPRVGFRDWRPYENGFWAPTDAYGWVWISNEPFGWATYHYGRWFFDEFDGWLWQPGTQWAPAWVSWQGNDQYIGWSPMSGGGGGGTQPPGGAYLFAPVNAMGATDLSAKIQTARQLGTAVADARPVSETVQVGGKPVPSGPSIERIERLAGQTLPRAQMDDLLKPQESSGREPAGEAAPAAPTLDEMRRVGEQASREARAIIARGGRPPLRLPMVRPVVERGLAPRSVPAAVDSLKGRPGG